MDEIAFNRLYHSLKTRSKQKAPLHFRSEALAVVNTG